MELHEGEQIHKVDIETQMRSSYIDYAMSVIVARALPDVRDGFKPVHRRVLFGMQGLGLTYGQPTKKSARIVGEVMGKYHPHGDSSVYDAMCRLAQPWSLRYPLVDGQGNFGSMDGDSPAAMRYTEARLAKITEDVLKDLDKETVDFMPNFDDSLQEPTVLPTRIPQLLVNGASGIAVGMATNMAPHNLSETVDAICAYIDNRDITIEELMRYIKAPDFPTGGIIYGTQGVRDAFLTGRGRIVIRAKTSIEETETGRTSIIITEVPYQVNKAEMIARIAEMVNDHKIEGISYINDETSRSGIRVVIILKRDAMPNVVLNHLFKQSQLQAVFPVNNIALVDGRPRLLNLKDLIGYFVKHRHEVVIRRSQYELRKAQDRMHILEGLLIAVDNIDEVVHTIRASSDVANAAANLCAKFSLSEKQAQAIVEMRLRALTGLEWEKLRAEHDELAKRIAYLQQLLSDERMQYQVIKDELLELKKQYGDARRTAIEPNAEEFVPEDFYADDDVVITISHQGYAKRTKLAEYRAQHRGGRGSQGGGTRDEDFIEQIYNATMHNTLLFFTNQGRCYWLRVYELPEGARNAKGKLLQNLINLQPEETVRTVLSIRQLDQEDFTRSHFVVLATTAGIVKKTCLAEYARPRSVGLIAMTIREGDHLLSVALTDGDSDIVLATRKGLAIRFHESNVRPLSRKSQGVTGIRMAEDDQVVGMATCQAEDTREILVVSEQGYCKRTALTEYRITNRGGKGIITLNVDKAGYLAGFGLANQEEDLMIITKAGIAIRFPVTQVSLAGRNTKGVRSIALGAKDAIASATTVPHEEEDNLPASEQNQETNRETLEDQPVASSKD